MSPEPEQVVQHTQGRSRHGTKWSRARPAGREWPTVGKTKEGKVYHHLWTAEEIDALLKEHGLGKQESEDQK